LYAEAKHGLQAIVRFWIWKQDSVSSALELSIYFPFFFKTFKKSYLILKVKGKEEDYAVKKCTEFFRIVELSIWTDSVWYAFLFYPQNAESNIYC